MLKLLLSTAYGTADLVKLDGEIVECGIVGDGDWLTIGHSVWPSTLEISIDEDGCWDSESGIVQFLMVRSLTREDVTAKVTSLGLPNPLKGIT